MFDFRKGVKQTVAVRCLMLEIRSIVPIVTGKKLKLQEFSQDFIMRKVLGPCLPSYQKPIIEFVMPRMFTIYYIFGAHCIVKRSAEFSVPFMPGSRIHKRPRAH